jgi:tetratricopeptide (TPR) repeat protein
VQKKEERNIKATDRLRVGVVTSDLIGLGQQMGVDLIKDGVSVEELLDFQTKPEREKQFVPPEKLPVILDINSQLLDRLTGLGDLIELFRTYILDLSKIKDISVTDRTSQDQSTTTEINVDQQLSKSLLNEKASIIEKYISNQVRIKLLLRAIRELDPSDQKKFKITKTQLENWQDILSELLPNLDKNQQLQAQIQTELEKQRGNGDEEIQRLMKMMSGERAQNDGEKQQLQQRVIKVLLGNTAMEKKDEVKDDLIEELFVTASTINDIRIIERLKEENIHLVKMRDLVRELQEEYKNDPDNAEEINKKIIDDIAIPIANAIHKLFPHIDSNSPSLIAAALYRKEALCVAKAEILASIFKLLGLKGKSVSVQKTMDDDTDHTIFQANIFNKTTLFIDANFTSFTDKNDHQMKEMQKQYQWSDEHLKRYAANRNAIRNQYPGSHVLIYIAKPKNIQGGENDQNITTIVELNGSQRNLKTSVPHPHQVVIGEKTSPISASAYYNHANNFHRLKLYFEAEEMYRKAIELSPNYEKTHSDLGVLLEELDRDIEAEAMYRKAIELNPNFTAAHYNLGLLLAKSGERDEEAIKMFEEVIKLDPKNAEAFNNLGDLLERSGERDEEAIKMFEEVIKLDPKNATPHYDLGNLLAKSGKRDDEAIKMYERTIELVPKSSKAHLNLGVLFARSGMYSEAREVYEIAIRLNPGSSIARLNLGNLFSKLHRNYEAGEIYKEAIELDDPIYKAWIITAYANSLKEIRRHERAIAQYQKALELMQENLFLPNFMTREEIENKIAELGEINSEPEIG